MKKRLFLPIFIGAFSLMVAQNTGVNTTNPKATLDIDLPTNYTTPNEAGVSYPRLTGNQIRDMKRTDLKKSTMVYATNAATDLTLPINAHASKITTEGFYYYDGAKWEVFTVGTQNGEWVYDAATNKTNLIRSGTNPFANKVYYDNANGNYWSFNSISPIQSYNWVAATDLFSPTITDLISIEAKNRHVYNSKNLSSGILEKRDLVVDDTDVGRSHTISQNIIYIPRDNANDFTHIYGNIFHNNLFGTGTTTGNTIAGWFSSSIGNNSKVNGYSTGVLTESSYFSSGNVNNMFGLYSTNSFRAGSGIVDYAQTINAYTGHRSDNTLINHYIGINNGVNAHSNNTGNGNYVMGLRNWIDVNTKTFYPNIYGIYNDVRVQTSSTKPTNLYGLYLTDIIGGATSNFSIYSNAGKIRFGDLAGTGTRNVVVDANGVLQIGSDANNNSGWSLTGNTGTSPSSNYVGTTDNQPLNFKTNATADNNPKMTITSDGYVGIGTSTPTAKLNVVSTNNVGASIEINSSSTSIANNDNLNLINTNQTVNNYSAIWFGDKAYASGTAGALIGAKWYDHNDATKSVGFDFYTSKNGNGSVKMSILPDGSTGIGTVGPTNRLEVNVDGVPLSQNRGITISGNMPSGGESSLGLTFKNTANSYNWTQYFGGPNGQQGVQPNNFEIWEYPQTGYCCRRRLVIDNSSADLSGGASFTKPVIITSTGSVKAVSFIASANTYADYVFEKYYVGVSNLNENYKFLSLPEVEKHIKQNGRLPGYPSAKEVLEKGEFDVSKQSITNHEKIEELFLHSIEQEKKIEQLQNENDDLKKRLEAVERKLTQK